MIMGDVRDSCTRNDYFTNQIGGLGLVPSPKMPGFDGRRDHRQSISNAIEDQRDEELMLKAMNQSVQGA